MGVKLTKRVIEAAEPAVRDQYRWDAEVKGFGLKITPAGRKVFVFQYRMGGRGARTERYTIGEYRSPYPVDGARTEAVRSKSAYELRAAEEAVQQRQVLTAPGRHIAALRPDHADEVARDRMIVAHVLGGSRELRGAAEPGGEFRARPAGAAA